MIPDGTISFRGGQNAGLDPHRIGPEQYAAGVNTTIRKGSLTPRPAFIHRPLKVLTDGGVQTRIGLVRSYRDIFLNGKFQGAGPYKFGSEKYIIAVISGVIFRINARTRNVEVISVDNQASEKIPLEDLIEPTSQRIDSRKRRVRWSQAGRFFTIFDYPDYPVIIEGLDARRADPDNFEIPASAIGAFNQNRLFVGGVVSEFTASDGIGNLLAPDAPISFQEVFAPAAPYLGQSFSLGSSNQNEPITAMGFIPAVDGSTEMGPLFVATKSQMYAYLTTQPRAQWEQSQFGRLVLSNVGVAGHRAFVPVNTDLYFMDGTGNIRSFNVARSDQGKWSHTPIDKEVSNWVKFIDDTLIELTVAAYFDQKVFFTVNPTRIEARDLEGKPVMDYAFNGMVVLNMDGLSGLLQGSSPAWDGVYTGIRPMELIDLEGEMYVFAKDPANANALYAVDPSKTRDEYDRCPKSIVSRLYTKGYTFDTQGGAGVFTLKEEGAVILGLKDLEGDVGVHVERSADSGPFRTWRKWIYEAPVEFEEMDEDALVTPGAHNFREVNLGSPADGMNDCNAVTGEMASHFNKLQLRVTIEAANWRLEDIRLMAEPKSDDQNIEEVVCDYEAQAVEDNTQCDFTFYSVPPREGDVCL